MQHLTEHCSFHLFKFIIRQKKRLNGFFGKFSIEIFMAILASNMNHFYISTLFSQNSYSSDKNSKNKHTAEKYPQILPSYFLMICKLFLTFGVWEGSTVCDLQYVMQTILKQ